MLSALRGNLRGEDGMTLVELLVTTSIGLVVMGAVAATTITLTRASRYSIEESYTQSLNQVALERVTRSLRQATYPEGRGPSNSTIFEEALPDDVIFFADIDNDDVIERLRYRLTADTLSQTTMECQNPACTTYQPTPQGGTSQVTDRIQNAVLDTGPCPALGTAVPVFRYFERSTDGSLAELAPPVSPSLYGRIASVEVRFVLTTSGNADDGCQDLSSLIHLRNWRS